MFAKPAIPRDTNNQDAQDQSVDLLQEHLKKRFKIFFREPSDLEALEGRRTHSEPMLCPANIEKPSVRRITQSSPALFTAPMNTIFSLLKKDLNSLYVLDRESYSELVQKCKNPAHKMEAGAVIAAYTKGFLNTDGSIDSSIRNMILGFNEEKEKFKLTPPLKRPHE